MELCKAQYLLQLCFWCFINDLLTLSLSSSAHAHIRIPFNKKCYAPWIWKSYMNGVFWVGYLLINIEKSHLIVFGKSKYKICLKLGDEILTQSNNTKLLGFYLSDLMTWNEHVEKLVTKVQNNINLFQLCWSYISTFAARQSCFQFLHSHLISHIRNIC